jgi:folate-binding protein YgfZ
MLRFHGNDARKFLQGQLSNDMNLLDDRRLVLAGYHNPQGRVLALLRLLAPTPDEIIALLPAELAEPTVTALKRFVLRAKLTISQDSSPAALTAFSAIGPLLAPDARARDITEGVPQVYAATSAMFVAQMLNLDCVQAISFTKGCYTGQEIIARSHYRGRIKRRMQRFLTDAPAALAPGQGVTLNDGRAAQIVDAIARADGRSEFLAVAPVPRTAGTAPPPAPASDTPAQTRLSCSPLPLPYALPE